MGFSSDELERYSRNILVEGIGGLGQQRLRAAKVLVVGAGGLGSPALLYLAAAGIGTLGIVDGDSVELSNLQRQVLHTTSRIAQRKTDSAKATLQALNPEIQVDIYACPLDAANADELVQPYDMVVDGSDNFPTRFLVNATCVKHKKTLVSAAIRGFEGQLSVYKGNPCYQCFHPEMPEEGSIPTCTQNGVLGAVAGVMGSLQAAEVVKEIIGAGESLAGKILTYDALTSRFRTLVLKPDLACPVCGDGYAVGAK